VTVVKVSTIVAQQVKTVYIKRVKQSKANSIMKWSIWLQPNKIVSEEYPDGWTRDDVMEAAQSRWAGKVNTVTPGDNAANAADGDYGNDYNEYDSDSSSSGFGMGFGGLIVAGLAIGGLVMINGEDDNKIYQPDTSSMIENIQKSFTDIAPTKDHPLKFSVRELPKSTPAQYRAEENGCDVWRKAQPALAAQLQPGQKCYR
jgi:hypothetical protein